MGQLVLSAPPCRQPQHQSRKGGTQYRRPFCDCYSNTHRNCAARYRRPFCTATYPFAAANGTDVAHRRKSGRPDLPSQLIHSQSIGMRREYYSDSIVTFLEKSSDEILGELVRSNNIDGATLERTQSEAWLEQIRILKGVFGPDRRDGK